VSNLLDITRIEAGVFTVHPNPTSVRDFGARSVNAMKPTMGAHRVDSIVPASLPAVNVDSLLIGQVLINLLDNAIRHSPDDGVITVEARREMRQVILSVTDQGPALSRVSVKPSSNALLDLTRAVARAWVSRSPRTSSRRTGKKSGTRMPEPRRAIRLHPPGG